MTLHLSIHPTGHHEAAWHHPGSQPGRVMDLAGYAELAQRADRADRAGTTIDEAGRGDAPPALVDAWLRRGGR